MQNSSTIKSTTILISHHEGNNVYSNSLNVIHFLFLNNLIGYKETNKDHHLFLKYYIRIFHVLIDFIL